MTPGEAEPAQRPDTDDYDLLTFGEVAARLSEELACETAQLQAARDAEHPDPDRIARIEERIVTLQTGGERYRREARTNAFFNAKFGSAVGTDEPGGRSRR